MEHTNQIIKLPVVCTRGIVYFPHNKMPLEVGRPRSLSAIQFAQSMYEKKVIILSQKNPEVPDPTPEELYQYGTIALVDSIRTNEDGSLRTVFHAIARVKIHEILLESNTYFALAEEQDDIISEKNEEIALVRQLAKEIGTMANASENFPDVILRQLTTGLSAGELSDLIAHYLPLSLEKKQELLETLDVNDRLQLLLNGIVEEHEINVIENTINQRVRQKLDESQREYVLREKLRAIKEELGDAPSKEDDTDVIRRELETNPYPQSIKDKVYEELKRYEMMPPSSAESSVIRNYIDWLMKTPWFQKTEDNNDLENVEHILNEDHFGLEKIKERIVEYLAVKKLTSSLKAPIICFSGPPGTGKTSLAMSIARALDRKFVKISLGGVKDESEIRGHRRTYLGSMPGRIIQGMKKAGVINPVFLLDEVDKMGADYKGDPSNALLEVLDPEQNKAFSDHFLEEPYDLSNVLFIATANYLENISGPLRDRLEIIELSSYTEMEKVEIAKQHLVLKQELQNGLNPKKIIFQDASLLFIIRNYTREAGVRNLERMIGTICRKVAVKILKSHSNVKQVITTNKVKEYLGKERFDYTKKEKKDQVGVTTGLAYTQYGGDILPVEITYFKGKGSFIVTGNIGNVMKESASIAIGYVKSNAKKYHINPSIFEKNDIHIHVPEGAVPKDGPSAGVTMTTSLISALNGKPVRADIAMTGEITLRGNVLPIGGLKEKLIAAHRSGIKTVFIPKENERDLDDIPLSIRNDLEIISVDQIDKIIKKALVQQDHQMKHKEVQESL